MKDTSSDESRQEAQIQELREELRYARIKINMLKRVVRAMCEGRLPRDNGFVRAQACEVRRIA
jgi:hypothetical protein